MRATATLLATLPLALAAPSKRAPLITPRGVDLVEGKYIIKTRESIDAAVQSINADADFVFKRFGGFSATLSPEEVDALRDDPNVEYIEQDAVVTLYATQEGAPWGLARLSNLEPGSTTYTYDDSAGSGTCAYVVDTGIDITHPEFEGRASWGANFADETDEDGHGHGTHVAGTIGSLTYGVAKQTTLYAVKVLDSQGSGTNAGVISGMEYVVEDAPTQECPNGVVVNMSLGGGFSAAVNEAAASIVEAGLFLAVAAGNGNLFGQPQDAANYSPASETSACTVGATDDSDNVASFSNYGTVLDVYAPGVDVLSTIPGGATDTFSGTSMASPHIAGLGAYYLGLNAAPVSELCSYIAETALDGVITGVRSGTANLLAQNGQA